MKIPYFSQFRDSKEFGDELGIYQKNLSFLSESKNSHSESHSISLLGFWKLWPEGHIWSVTCFLLKLYGNSHLHLCLHVSVSSGCLGATNPEVSSCHRDCMFHKAKTIIWPYKYFVDLCIYFKHTYYSRFNLNLLRVFLPFSLPTLSSVSVDCC